MTEMIQETIGTPCLYCGTKITYSNMSVDHYTPLLRSKIKKGEYSEQELEKLNNKDNLHIICDPCNRAKGEIPHRDFMWLLDILSLRPEVKEIILRKLKQSAGIWHK